MFQDDLSKKILIVLLSITLFVWLLILFYDMGYSVGYDKGSTHAVPDGLMNDKTFLVRNLYTKWLLLGCLETHQELTGNVYEVDVSEFVERYPNLKDWLIGIDFDPPMD